MKPIRFYLLMIIIVFTTTFLTYIFYNSYIIEKEAALDIKLKIGAHAGLNADPDSINFGMLMLGSKGQRSIFVNNNATYPLKVTILKSGEIADWIKLSKNNFILKENDRQEIIFEASPPNNADFGNYTAQAKVIFKKTFFNR